jgi:predicted nucleic acid-binding protein
MGKRFLIDTNIIIYHFKDEIPDHATAWIDGIFKASFSISIITKIEFLGWKDYTHEQFNQASQFLSNANVVSLKENIVNKAIQLRRQMRIKLPDAIIAATCIIKNHTLVTRNTEDFKNIAGLDIINPFKDIE